MGILKTKLYRQTPPGDAVNRRELLRGLQRAAEVGFTLVSAPAGFGKSTLAAAWLAECALPSAWLSLDHGDSDLPAFLEYFVAAVQEVFPDACAGTLALGKAAVGGAAAGGAAAAEVAASLINELDALPAEFVCVLDDYHVIDNQAVHELITTMILHPPRTLHLVVCSRVDPPLPLPRLRAQGRMVELRSPDLRFSPGEAAAFYTQQLGYALDDATLATLDRYIEGWPVGLRLAAAALRRQGKGQELLAALAQWQGHTLDYLVREVLSQLDPALENALVRLSILDRFCPQLYAALCLGSTEPTAAAAGRQFVTQLQDADLFLIPLDDTGQWFRFHASFLEMLRARSRLRGSEAERAELHRAASAWFAAAGLFDEALAHALQAGDAAAAGTLVAGARYTAINAEDWARLDRWLSLLPPDAIRRSPSLLLCRAWLLQYEFRLGQLPGMLDEIAAQLREEAPGSAASEHALMACELAVMRSNISCWSAQGSAAVASALQALAGLPPEHTFLRGSAYLYYCLGMQMVGKGAEGTARLHAALEAEGRVSSTFTTRIMIAVGGSHWMAADLAAALRIARQGLEVAQARHLPASYSWLCMLAGFVHYQWDDLHAAAAACRDLVDHPAGAHPMALGHVYLLMARIEQARGCAAEAQQWADKAYALALQAGIAPLLYQVEAAQARLNLANGATAAAKMWAQAHRDRQPPVMPVFLELPQLLAARTLLQEPDEESLRLAAAGLREARSFIEQTHNTLHEIELLCLEALLYAGWGQASTAHRQLTRALKLAEPGGIVRTFVDMGPDLAAQLHSLARQRRMPAHAVRVVQALPPGGVDTAALPVAYDAGAAAVEPLTNRELQVLELLSERLSNKEIAQQLVLSPQTVKSHLHHIFEKLGVSQRREAVARGRAAGLLRP